jgi:hypothetical protein
MKTIMSIYPFFHKVASPVKSGSNNQLMQAKVFMKSLFHHQPKTAADA